MTPIGCAWTGAEWVGEHALDTRTTAANLPSHRRLDPTPAPWNLIQWPGSPTGRPLEPWRPPAQPDTSGGFSGFGVPDTGGFRWVSTKGLCAPPGRPSTGEASTRRPVSRTGARAA